MLACNSKLRGIIDAFTKQKSIVEVDIIENMLVSLKLERNVLRSVGHTLISYTSTAAYVTGKSVPVL